MSFNPLRYETVYGFSLLDDLHNLLPEILYDTGLFTSMPLVGFLQRRVATLCPDDYIRNRAHYRMYQQTRRRQESGLLIPASLILPTFATSGPLATAATTAAVATAETTVPLPPTIPATTTRYQMFTTPLTSHTLNAADTSGLMDTILSAVFMGAGLGSGSGLPSGIGLDSLEPVIVAPTPEQIAQATILTSIEPPADVVCAICQDHVTEEGNQEWRYIRHCHHKFHRSCVDRWFSSNVHCPVCRYDIRTEETE
jgi:hypothetical protein